MPLQDQEAFIEQVVARVCMAVNAQRDSIHDEEHIWLRERIEKEKQRAEFYRKTSQMVFGTVLAAFLIWLGSKGVAFAIWAAKN